MRKTLMIVLIVALTFVIGSASAASAAKPDRTAIAVIDSVNATGFHVHWMWDDWGVWGYQLRIYDLSDGDGARWTGSVEWQDKRTTHMATAGYPNPVHYGFDTFPPDPTHDYAIELTLFKKNGALLRQVCGSWSPTLRTVTLSETNDLSDVAIQVFLDPGRTHPIGDRLSTDIAGDAIIGLPDGATYYYGATRTDYYEFSRSFTIASASLTENFTMKPFNTVTFAEGNGLSDVSIQVYTDSKFRYPVGVPLTTNSSGEATIRLPNQTFHYAAAKTGYSDTVGDFTLFEAPAQVDFEMLAALYTVTFDERNGLGGVSIVVCSDPGRTDEIVSRTTRSSGQATCMLPDGTYYYTATKASYADLPGDFAVSGAALTESFEMLADLYTVTFNETNGLEGVSVVVYSDPGRTDDVASGTTNSSGHATCTLPDGTYYYKAAKASYGDLPGDFTVSGGPLTESFEMVPGLYTVTFDETNGLSDVVIQVFSDPGLENPIGDSLTTDAAGDAVVNLPDGVTYYYGAAKTDYYELSGNFTLAGANMTETFTMKSFNTVTFVEANELSGVSIQLYSDNAFQNPVGDPLTTDSSGQATIKLPNGTFYYTAANTNYLDTSGNFTLLDAASTVDFEMLPAPYTVTFNETHGLEGVSIVVYSDPGRTDDIVSRTTDSSGQAACTLPDGTYYYTATKASYADLRGDFAVSGAALTESFEMLADLYTVTFNETNGLEGVSIVVYSDPGRTDDIASRTTNSSGQAACILPDGTYYYKATKASYANLPGDFAVSGAALTESFQMVASNTTVTVFAEDFTGIASGSLPSGWTTTNPSLCRVRNANHAGGSVPELALGCAPDYNVYLDYYVATPSIDATTTSSALNLSFKTYFSLYGDSATYPYTYAVETSDDDGATWTTVLQESPTLTTYPIGHFQRTESIDISTCAGQTIMIRWRLYGYTWWMNAWHIDDIVVTGF